MLLINQQSVHRLLFFVVLITNGDYQVVASFALKDDTTTGFSEALFVSKLSKLTW